MYNTTEVFPAKLIHLGGGLTYIIECLDTCQWSGFYGCHARFFYCSQDEFNAHTKFQPTTMCPVGMPRKQNLKPVAKKKRLDHETMAILRATMKVVK